MFNNKRENKCNLFITFTSLFIAILGLSQRCKPRDVSIENVATFYCIFMDFVLLSLSSSNSKIIIRTRENKTGYITMNENEKKHIYRFVIRKWFQEIKEEKSEFLITLCIIFCTAVIIKILIFHKSSQENPQRLPHSAMMISCKLHDVNKFLCMSHII